MKQQTQSTTTNNQHETIHEKHKIFNSKTKLNVKRTETQKHSTSQAILELVAITSSLASAMPTHNSVNSDGTEAGNTSDRQR
jgi:hypothetical protein